MTRLLLCTLAFALSLGACAKRAELTYELKLTLPADRSSLELINAVERVLTRRLAAAEIEGTATTALTTKDRATLRLRLRNAGDAESIEHLLAEEFTFELRVQEAPLQLGAEQEAQWVVTGIDGEDLAWIQVIGDERTGRAGVELLFTPGGREEFAAVVAAHQGKPIGIFVRDLLMSKATFGPEAVQERIVISGLPSFERGEVFADDVNVGLHVEFIPT